MLTLPPVIQPLKPLSKLPLLKAKVLGTKITVSRLNKLTRKNLIFIDNRCWREDAVILAKLFSKNYQLIELFT
jgi:hypothetical protein